MDVLDTFEAAIRQALTRNGLILTLTFYILTLLTDALSNSIIQQISAEKDPVGLIISGNPYVLGAIYAALVLINLAVAITALRRLHTDDHPLTDNLLSAGLHTIIGNILLIIPYALLTIITALLWITYWPLGAITTVFAAAAGIYIFIALYTWTVNVAVNDDNAITALQKAWSHTTTHRIEILGILCLQLIVAAAFFAIINAPASLLAEPITAVITPVTSAAMTVLGLSVVVETHKATTKDA